MASLLRSIVAGPRARHPDASGLDLSYITDNIIATSGPSHTYPQRAYRNPLDRLVAFLDSKHGANWAIWEFRGEGTGYPDELVYNRVRHYPFPDHHPPPFRIVPLIVASMRNWLAGNDLHDEKPGIVAEGEEEAQKKRLATQVLDKLKQKHKGRVVVVHCKAGKGRSGTMACSYLIAECGWTPEQALTRFTERRMRPKFGAGVSIPSQLRWVGYVDRWTKGGKRYVDRELEIVEIHVWGLRNGVKLDVEAFIEDGRKIKSFHTYTRKERMVVEGNPPGGAGMFDMVYDMTGYASPTVEREVLEEAKGEESPGAKSPDGGVDTPLSTASKSSINRRASKLIRRLSQPLTNSGRASPKDKIRNGGSNKPGKSSSRASTKSSTSSLHSNNSETEPGGQAVIFKTETPIRIPTNDVNISLERRSRAPASLGLTMVTAVAHVWFNAFFEGNGPEQDGVPDTEGVFEIDWSKMDGIKGTWQKGPRAADRIAVVWRSVVPEGDSGDEGAKKGKGGEVVEEPRPGAPVPQMQAADWKGGNDEDPNREKKLGLRLRSPDSADVSQASSIKGGVEGKLGKPQKEPADSIKAVKSDVGGNGSGSGSGSGSDEEPSGSGGSAPAEMSDEQKLEAYAEKLPSPEGANKTKETK